jgi:hypothetical protein
MKTFCGIPLPSFVRFVGILYTWRHEQRAHPVAQLVHLASQLPVSGFQLSDPVPGSWMK